MDTSSAFILIFDILDAVKAFVSTAGDGVLGLLSSTDAPTVDAPAVDAPAAE